MLVESNLVNLKLKSESILFKSYKFRYFYYYELNDEEKSDYILYFKLIDESNDKESKSFFYSWLYERFTFEIFIFISFREFPKASLRVSFCGATFEFRGFLDLIRLYWDG